MATSSRMAASESSLRMRSWSRWLKARSFGASLGILDWRMLACLVDDRGRLRTAISAIAAAIGGAVLQPWEHQVCAPGPQRSTPTKRPSEFIWAKSAHAKACSQDLRFGEAANPEHAMRCLAVAVGVITCDDACLQASHDLPGQ